MPLSVTSQFEKIEPHRHIGHDRNTHSLCGTLCFYCFYVVQKIFHTAWFKLRRYISQIQKKINPYIYKKYYRMSLLNQQKGKKKNDKKKNQNNPAPGSKFIQKPQANTFVSKQANTGSQRGS